MNRLRCAVVGVGYLGRFHAQKYKSVVEAELVGVCDLRLDVAQKVGAELGVKAYENYKDLVGQVDAVTVAADTSAHFEIAKFFLENRIHVNVEKPITSTSKEARQLCDLARKNNLKLQVGHVERFNPALTKAREVMDRPLFIECHRLAPFKPRGVDVDVVLDLMIHDLDVILSLVGSEPVEIWANGTPVLLKTSDIANARIKFQNGTVANVTASRVSQKSERKFRVFQPDQYLSIDFGSGQVQLVSKTGEFKGRELPIEIENWTLEKGDALLEETKSFVDAVLQDREVVVSGEEGLAALELAEAIIGKFEK